MVERDVIVRAFGAEPVRLRAFAVKNIGKRRVAVIVGRATNAATIGFPPSDVFEYDESVYAALRRAFDADEGEVLRERWRDWAIPFALEREF